MNEELKAALNSLEVTYESFISRKLAYYAGRSKAGRPPEVLPVPNRIGTETQGNAPPEVTVTGGSQTVSQSPTVIIEGKPVRTFERPAVISILAAFYTIASFVYWFVQPVKFASYFLYSIAVTSGLVAVTIIWLAIKEVWRAGNSDWLICVLLLIDIGVVLACFKLLNTSLLAI